MGGLGTGEFDSQVLSHSFRYLTALVVKPVYGRPGDKGSFGNNSLSLKGLELSCIVGKRAPIVRILYLQCPDSTSTPSMEARNTFASGVARGLV